MEFWYGILLRAARIIPKSLQSLNSVESGVESGVEFTSTVYTRRRDTGHSASAKSPWTRTLNSPFIFTVTSLDLHSTVHTHCIHYSNGMYRTVILLGGNRIIM